MSTETIDKTFQLSGEQGAPARLRLRNIRGSVDIQPGEEGKIIIQAVKHTGSGDSSRTEIRMEQLSDGTVVAETHFAASGFFFFPHRPCKVDYVVRVPGICSADVSLVSSSLAVRGLAGEFHLSSVSGDIQVDHLDGRLRATTVSGRLNGTHLSGVAEFETVSGDVCFEDARFTGVRGNTVSGFVELDDRLGTAPCRFDSVSGSVRMRVPASSAASVRISSISGRVSTSLPSSSRGRQDGWQRYEINGGGRDIRFHTISGDLRVAADGIGPDSAADPSFQRAGMYTNPEQNVERPANQDNGPDSAMTTVEILDRIERGEITVEQGLTLIKEQV